MYDFMRKDELYHLMNISPIDIEKGENIFASFTEETKRHFLADIYAERTSDGYYKTLQSIYGKFPDFRKVIVINFALSGNDSDKKKIAHSLSNPYNHKEIETNFFELTYQWLNETTDENIIESLSRGLMFYLDDPRTIEYLNKNIKTNFSFVKGVVSWLYIQPDWYRKKHKQVEMNIWKEITDIWSKSLTDEFKIREIKKSLGLEIDKNEIWFHEIENPWNYTDKKIKELASQGIDIKIKGYIGEFAMGSPAITDLVLNKREFKKAIGGPFLVDDQNEFLCCTTFKREEGFKLVAINLSTNEIIELDSSLNIYCPYKFENGEFIVITKQDKIDLTKDVRKYKLTEIKTTHNSTFPQASLSWWQKLFRN